LASQGLPHGRGAQKGRRCRDQGKWYNHDCTRFHLEEIIVILRKTRSSLGLVLPNLLTLFIISSSSFVNDRWSYPPRDTSQHIYRPWYRWKRQISVHRIWWYASEKVWMDFPYPRDIAKIPIYRQNKKKVRRPSWKIDKIRKCAQETKKK